MKGTTKSGFEFEIDDDLFDDYEILEGLCSIDRGETSTFPILVKDILGDDQLARLKNHVRTEKGKVPATALMNEFEEILSASNKGKNS